MRAVPAVLLVRALGDLSLGCRSDRFRPNGRDLAAWLGHEVPLRAPPHPSSPPFGLDGTTGKPADLLGNQPGFRNATQIVAMRRDSCHKLNGRRPHLQAEMIDDLSSIVRHSTEFYSL